MSRRTIEMTDRLYDYLLTVGVRESEVLRRLRERTAEMPRAGMQISPEQGQFMALLVRLIGATRAIEIGTFTGYSSICVAEAMGETGRLIACDVSEEYTAVAREFWAEAGVDDRIELRLAPALQTLDALVDDGQANSFDFAFIDADKENQLAYYERCLELVRPGGLVAVDNTLWGGSVADPEDDRDSTAAIRRFNAAMADDQRVDLSLVPIGDGLTLARKREER